MKSITKNLVVFGIIFAIFGCASNQNISANQNSSVSITSNPSTTASVADRPTGFASVGASENFGGYGKPVYTVSTREDLINKAKAGNCIIYIDGMIDITEGMLPSSGKTSTEKLDNFIKSNTAGKTISASSYSEWKKIYAANVKSTEDESGNIQTVRKALQNAWKKQIQVAIGSNTTIIGLGNNSGIKGGTISINKVQNVAIRNLFIQDAFDPFPKMEGGDGYNAEWDCVVIDNSEWYWVSCSKYIANNIFCIYIINSVVFSYLTSIH